MLVRAGTDGEWLQLKPVDGIPSGDFRSLCGADAASFLELEAPMPVAAFGPWPAGNLAGIDALCLTQHGDIELLVATWGEEPRDTLWRMLDVAGALRGTSLEAFASHLTELAGETSVTRWLHQRVGGDATRLEERLRQVLDSGDFGFVLVTTSGAGDLAQPLQFVQQGSARIRVFEVEVLRAGEVQAIEGIEVPLVASDAAASAATDARARPAPVLTVVPAPTPVPVPVPVPEPEAFEREAVTPPATAPESAPETAPESRVEESEAEVLPVAPEDPSDVETFFGAIDRLDHRTSAHLRWLHDALLRLVDEAEYTTDGDRQFLTGWMHGSDRLPLFLLDSRGLLQLVIASLPEHEQREYADEVAGMLPEIAGSVLLEAGYADVDVPAHLDDQTLLEYLVDNLVEALPGGREAFGTHAPDELGETAELIETADRGEPDGADHESVPPAEGIRADDDLSEESTGDDFFAGVSGSHDASDVETTVAGLGGQRDASDDARADDETAETGMTVEDADTQPQREWAEPAAPPKSGGSRWLRRRGAA